VKTSIPQIFDEVEKAGSKEAKIKTLRAYDHPILKGMLQINFDPNVKMNLPEGESNLFVEFRRFYIWLQDDINLTRGRKEQLFIQLLEGIHWTEAEAVCLAKDRKLQTKYKSLKEDLIREAFPGLLPNKPIIPPLGEPKVKKMDSLNAS